MKNWWLVASLAGWLGAVSLAGVARAQKDDTTEKVSNDFYTLMTDRLNHQKSVVEDDAMPFVERCWDIYDQSAGEPEEFAALRTILDIATQTTKGTRIEEAWQTSIKHLAADFVDDARLAVLVRYTPAPPRLEKERDAFLADVKARTKSIDVKAAFAYNDVRVLLDEESQGKLTAEKEKRLIEQLNALARDFAAVHVPSEGVTYAEFVKKALYTLEHLKVGAVAPEIVGKDLDGVEFKLSDYRGKVVLVDFWGFW